MESLSPSSAESSCVDSRDRIRSRVLLMMNNLWSKPHEVHTPWAVELALRFHMERDRLRVTFPWGDSQTIATTTTR
jgi:hypothetical protein